MNEAASPTPASTESTRLLVRLADDRVVAGVCAGLARYFGLNPLVYRIAFAALVLLGGSGVILYAAAWLVIPDEERGDSIVGLAARGRRSEPWLAIGAGLVAFGVLFGLTESGWWPDTGDLWVIALAVGVGIVWQQLRGRRGGETPQSSDVSMSTEASPVVVAPPAPSRRRIPVFLPTIGTLIAGAGILGVLQQTDVLDVDWTLALAGAVGIVGVAVAIGAFFGTVGGLASVGALLAAALVVIVTVDVPLEGRIGERELRPLTPEDLNGSYEHAIGRLELDLREIALPAGTTRVEASVGIGELTVIVPDHVRVAVDAEVQGGESRILGSTEDGWDVRHGVARDDAPAGTPVLELGLTVGFGELEVRRG